MATPSITMIPSGYKAQKVYSVLPTNGDGDFTFDRNNIGTRVNKNGLIEQLATDIPRLDYSDGSCPSLLLEPSSTNLFNYSQDFSQSDWFKSSSVATGGILIPDGTNSGYKLVVDNGVNASAVGAGLRREVNLTAGIFYTYSVFVKKAELYNTTVLIDGVNNNEVSYSFDLNNGSMIRESIKGNYTDTSYSIKEYESGWWRVSISFKPTATATVKSYVWHFKNNDYTDDIGDGVNGIYVWGAQFEALPYATSYIPTTIQPASRGVDSAFKDGLSSYISSTSGVLYAEFAALSNEDNTFRVFSLSDGGSVNRIFIGFDSSNDVYASIGGEFIQDFTPTDATDFIKAAIKYEDNNSKLFVNGNQISTTNTTATVPSGLNRLGFDSGAGSSRFHVKTKDLRVYNTALTDAELITLTTI